MAKNRVIEINGIIEQYGYSMNYVKYMMDQLGDGPITVKMTSLGGDVQHALKIKDMFATHGDVTVEYIGFNASSSTIVGHGAKKTVIHDDALYLIHKPMVWVDAWGRMNEDELEAAIADMVTQKKNAETVCLSIAQDYVNSRGMDFKLVMDLMKEARWLSAKEALEYGLVDEVVKSGTKKTEISNQMVAMIESSGLPMPILQDDKEKRETPENQSWFAQAKEFFTPKNTNEMNKTFECLNKVLNVEGLSVADNKIAMTVEQITAINSKMQALELSATNATTERDTATASLAAFTASIDAIDPSVKNAADPTAKVAAITAKLAERPGSKIESPQGDSGAQGNPADEVDQEGIDDLAHNKLADKVL